MVFCIYLSSFFLLKEKMGTKFTCNFNCFPSWISWRIWNHSTTVPTDSMWAKGLTRAGKMLWSSVIQPFRLAYNNLCSLWSLFPLLLYSISLCFPCSLCPQLFCPLFHSHLSSWHCNHPMHTVCPLISPLFPVLLMLEPPGLLVAGPFCQALYGESKVWL